MQTIELEDPEKSVTICVSFNTDGNWLKIYRMTKGDDPET